MEYKFPVAKPEVTTREKRYVNEALDAGEISSKGSFVPRFEEAFAEAVGTRYAVACSSGTTALTLALAALGVGPGDEVIVPDFTMIATAWSVSYLGATPVFVDCGKDGNLDVAEFEKAITSKTRAVMPVHVYGRPCAMEAITDIARRRNLHVVEDCAEAFGATYGDLRVGTFGIAGCFSLFANKIITAGEGGVITTSDLGYAEELRRLRSMYFDPKHTFLHPKLGYNFRMTNLQAAFGLAQVERYPEIAKRRKRLLEAYDSVLSSFTLPRPPGSVLWVYDVLAGSDYRRKKALEHLEKKGVETRLFFKPMRWQPMYAPEGEPSAGQNASDLASRGFYLPTYNELEPEDAVKIAKETVSFL